MNARKVARKRRLVDRLEHELEAIIRGSRKTPYQLGLLKNGVSVKDAQNQAIERHRERIAEAERGL